MTKNVHDHLAKEVFSRSEEAKTLLRAFLPEEQLRAVDLDSLTTVPGSFVEDRFRDRHSDLLFSVKTRGTPVLVYLLFEHKSFQDRWLVLQLLIYVTRIWIRWRAEHGEGCRLPMILPVVLYHGDQRWSRPLRLIDLCQGDGKVRDLLGPYQPTLPLTLIDLSQMSESHLQETLSRGTALATLTVLLMKSIRSTGLLRRLRSWMSVIRQTRAETGGRQMLELLVSYILLAAREEVDEDGLLDVLSDAIGSEGEELVMNTGEKLIQKGKETGLREGIREGIREGKRQGMKEGKRQGMREALSSILRARFGELPQVVHQDQTEAADLETLQKWLDRAIVAASVDEVFAE